MFRRFRTSIWLEPFRAMTNTRLAVDFRIQSLPASLQALMTFERFNLHRRDFWQNTARDPSFDIRYLPQNCAPFLLPCYWVRRKHLYIYECHVGCAETLRWKKGRHYTDQLLFPIHPLSLPLYRDFLTRVGAEDATTTGPRVV